MKEVLSLIEFPSFTEERLNEKFKVHEYWRASDREAFLDDCAEKIEAIACMGGVPVTPEFMDRLPNLKIVSVFGVGYDAVNVEHAKKIGVQVTNTPDVLNDCVADLAMGLVIGTARQMVPSDRYVRNGDWGRQGMYPLTTSLGGKRLGIVGMGRIGEAVARRARAFNMQINYFNRRDKGVADAVYYSDPVLLAENSDFLVLTCPGGEQTFHLVNAEVLKALGPRGYLINVSRGSVVKEDDLLTALVDGTIAGAGLDVFANEPNADPAFAEMDNVLLQPHAGSATNETRKAMGDLMIDNLIAYFEGRAPLSRVA